VIGASLRFAKSNVVQQVDSLSALRHLPWGVKHSTTETVMSLHSSKIQVTYDFICPWCWIGEENLERALAASGFSTDRPISFLPYQLNPDMPVRGMDRKAYRSGKFGSWARSQAMDAQVTHAGKAVGLEFDYERVEKTPTPWPRIGWYGASNRRVEMLPCWSRPFSRRTSAKGGISATSLCWPTSLPKPGWTESHCRLSQGR